jgi:hypothetical protein
MIFPFVFVGVCILTKLLHFTAHILHIAITKLSSFYCTLLRRYVVGYQTASGLASGQFKAFAVQFDAVGGGDINVKDAIVVADAAGTASINDGADQIWRWDTANAQWTKYFFRKQRTTVYGWCKAGETSATTDTIPAGETFFFRRGSGSAASDVTMSGAVKPFDATVTSYTTTGGQLVFMANPWPTSLAIKGFEAYQTSPSGTASINDGADQIWRWDTANAQWTKYFFRKQRTTVYGWCKAGETAATEDVIPSGEGFFFRRGSGSAADTVQLKAPSAN